MIFRHAEYTGSRWATEILLGWDEMAGKFIRVLPHDYKRALEEQNGAMDFEVRIGELRTRSADFSG
jgi:glutamate synthase domain-containing protein 3